MKKNKKKEKLAPTDWRVGGARAANQLVPKPPRTPTPFARDLIFGYHGSQKVLLIIGIVFMAFGLLLIVALESAQVKLLIAIFPAVGLLLFGSAVRSNRREIRAFREGKAIKGLVVKRGYDETTEINEENPFEIIWEFQVDGKNYKGRLAHMDPDVLNRALPENEVTVLYDPRDPKVNTVWLE